MALAASRALPPPKAMTKSQSRGAERMRSSRRLAWDGEGNSRYAGGVERLLEGERAIRATLR